MRGERIAPLAMAATLQRRFALLGGTPRPLRAYNSCGLGLMSPQAAADEAQALLEGCMRAVKLRLGYPTLQQDLAVTCAVRGSGWMQAAGVAEAHGNPMSSHLMPEVSAQLLAATPTCHYLEYVDWTDCIAQEPVRIRDGCWPMDGRPGTGLAWDAAKVGQYRIA